MTILFLGALPVYAGSIGINISSDDQRSTVPLTLSDGPTGPLAQRNWNNWNVDAVQWVSKRQLMADGTYVPAGISVNWSWNAGLSSWAGVDNDGSILPEPGRSGVAVNTLDYTGVGGQYSATVTVSGIPSSWGTSLTVWALGDDYGGLSVNRWDMRTLTVAAGAISFVYPGGDGRSGGFIKAVQLSGPLVDGVGASGTTLLVR